MLAMVGETPPRSQKVGENLARIVTCAATGEKGTNEVFLKIGGKYYKSQFVYDEYCRKKEAYKQIVEFICDNLLDYQQGQKFPSIIAKKLKDLSFYDNEVILQTFQSKEQDIRYWLSNKEFNSEFGKISYIFAIIQNHINDVHKTWKRDNKKTSRQDSEIATVSVDNIGVATIKGKDISKWLEDDEL